jgi:UDP-N-acetylglucosamine--N-acetylmuramyl-(pentapeptide) pyrophosphoryl-undecaprenol N-acetylglucosamine transferase
VPSLAVAQALRRRGVLVTFAGAQRAEAELVPAAGFELDSFAVAGFPRRLGVGSLRAAGRAAAAVPAAIRILRRRRPDVVLGGGGYVSGPVVAAAAALRIPALVMEADAHLGLANRMAAPFARRVLLAFPIEGLDGEKYRVVGRPIPEPARTDGQADARARFGLPAEGPLLLVFGGSQGAAALNEAALAAFAAEGPAVLHLAGPAHAGALAPRVSRPDYVLLPFTEDFGAALAAADLVVARAGGSVWEVAAAGKPALLVPYPHATAGHQAKNAAYFAERGGAVAVEESELDLRPQVEALLGDPERLRAMGDAMRSLARPDAAEIVAEEVIAAGAVRR